MVPTVQHILMTAHGTLPAGDVWSCGLRSYHTTTALSPASGQALALAVANQWRVFHNSTPESLGTSNSASFGTLAGVTVRELNIEGITTAQYESAPSTAVGAATLAATLPNQCALAVSLITDRAGRTGKGRIYLPALGLGSAAIIGGYVTSAMVTKFSTAVKIMLDGINTDLTTNFGEVLKLAVQSPTAAKQVLDAGGSLPDYNGAVITGYKIGNVVDTQRRRRSALKETYTTGVVA